MARLISSCTRPEAVRKFSMIVRGNAAADGWTDAKGVAHMWHMNYNEVAERDMMQTIVSAIKTRKFGSKIEVR